jgi:(+)-pinoresinol hydroxylase
LAEAAEAGVMSAVRSGSGARAARVPFACTAGAIVCLATAFLTGRAVAADPPPYISWTRSPVIAKPGDPRGYVQFQRDCAICHGKGPGRPGTRSLRAKYHGRLPALLERRTDLTASYIKYIVRHGVTVMPPFRKTEVSDADLDAIAAYLTRKRPRPADHGHG